MQQFLAIVAVVLGLGTPSFADDARPRAAVTRTSGGVEVVVAGGRRLWRGERGEQVITTAVWSSRRDAVAFATRAQTGAVNLVVVLVGGDAHGHTMTWPIPARARPSRRRGSPTVTWLGSRKVAYGRSQLTPAIVASWRLR